MMQNQPFLKALNITKLYDIDSVRVFALKDVSLEIYTNDFISITGKSGSGKSTLMHIIGLLDTPTSGQLFLNNEDVSRMSEQKLAVLRNKEIGFVFQAYNLLERTTALDNVILPLKYSSVPGNLWTEKAKEVLEIVGLKDRMQHKSSELSGGQKQRVAIARALVNDPSLILADEPTGNLDTKTGEEIIELFKKLNENGKTIVIVTHDTELASIARKKITLVDGQRV